MKRQDFARLKREQERLARKVSLRDAMRISEIRTIAGCDLTFLNPWKTPTEGIACIVRVTFPELRELDRVVVRARVSFPYVPGYLAYREMPLMLRAYRKVRGRVDVYLVDGQGIAHPRRFGIAAHFGVVTGEMTIGCAKSWLYGDFRVPSRRGAVTRLADDSAREIGRVIRPSAGKSLLFISPGHLVSAKTSTEIIKSCLKDHRHPEPIRLAHNHLQEWRRALLAGSPATRQKLKADCRRLTAYCATEPGRGGCGCSPRRPS